MDARQPRRSGTAHDVCEHRLSLIVCGMCDGNARCAAFVNKPLEKCIPQAPAGILEIPSVLVGNCRDILALDNEFNFARTGELRDETCVLFGFIAPQAVIEMNHEQRDSQIRPEHFEQSHKRQRISASRHRDAHAIAGHKEARCTNRGEDGLFQRDSHLQAVFTQLTQTQVTKFMVAAGRARVERGKSDKPNEVGCTAVLGLQTFRYLASVKAEVMRNAPVERNSREVGAPLPFAFEPCGNARNHWTDAQIYETQRCMIGADHSNLSLVVWGFRTEMQELKQTAKVRRGNRAVRNSHYLADPRR
jgi:hypothetical protein